MDWAKHRRRKAAAKMHLRLNLHTFLPSFAIVDTAAHHDNKRARELCAGCRPAKSWFSTRPTWISAIWPNSTSAGSGGSAAPRTTCNTG
jgi:hypothetical protein